MEERQATVISTITAFVLGGIVGASVALLMAPMSGSDTRQLIADKGSSLKDKAKDTVDDTRSKASDAFSSVTDRTKKRAASMGKRGKGASQRVKNIQQCIRENVRA